MEGNEWKTQTIELAINDITVKQEDKSQPLNFKFVKDGDNNVFQNNGANIIVTKSNGEDQATTLSKQQVIAIQENDIKVFANLDTFTEAIQEKNISQTFALATGEEKAIVSWIEDKEVSLLSLLSATTQPIEIKEEITKEISSVLTDEKEIVDPSQDEKVSASLSEGAYISELKVLESAFLEGNDKAFEIIYTKIENRIQTIYQSFGMIFTKTEGDPATKIQWLKTAIKTMRDNITIEYNIPPTYIENLQSIEKSLTNSIAQEYGSVGIQETEITIPAEKNIQE